MDDLISRKAAIEALEFERDCLETPERINGVEDAIEVIQQLPSIAAVPLEPLCKYLAGYAAPPIRSPLAIYGSLEEAWKAFLMKWMEEQDAAD